MDDAELISRFVVEQPAPEISLILVLPGLGRFPVSRDVFVLLKIYKKKYKLF